VSLLRHLEGDPGFPELIADLGSSARESSIGAQNVLAVAGGLRSNGIAVELIPRCPPQRTPDFRANLAGRWVTFEAVALQPSGERRKADEVRASLERWAHETGIASSWFVKVKLDQTPGEALSRLDDLKQQIQEAVLKNTNLTITTEDAWTIHVCQGQGPVPILVDGFILDTFAGVGEQREMQRVLRRIREKSAQLEKEPGPTVVIVRNDSLFVPAHLRKMHTALVETAQRILDGNVFAGLPHVGAVLDYEEWTGSLISDPLSLRGESYLATVGSTPEGIHRAALLALNPAALTPVSATERDLLVGRQMQW
jgi:hypothetical protein